MSQVIAGTYEIIREIGSGGGGIVYLGQHLRLGKMIVLKADKRTLSTKEETLRREVDALKDLNQTYIPQVYDFVQQDGVVYTVMDYIEGESLDKPLKRGERFEQSRVVTWACELLEALCYLHSRPPYGILHSDIKPANIMLTPEGDIRLIDFNIALALGEEGAVRVGYSQGYASPEHYGLDYSGISQTQGVESGKTELPANPAGTQLPTDPGKTVVSRNSGLSGSSGGRHRILLDVRSDIYSLGATLYHLLLGKRPAQDAKDVQPISQEDGVSPAVAAIINKAMQPSPEMRYQTAAEMLWDFEHLHENDPRTKRLKRREQLAAGLLAALFLCGGAMAFAGSAQMRRDEELARVLAEQEAETERLAKKAEQNAKEALELVDASRAAWNAGDAGRARKLALEALEKDTQYNAAAQYALTDALGVYDLLDGFKADKSVTLPGESIKQAVSPSGEYAAVLTSGQISVIELSTGEILQSLPANPSALSDMVFTADDILLYAGENALCAFDLSAHAELWQSGEPITGIALSADGGVAAAARADGEGTDLYDVQTGAKKAAISFDGLRRSGPVNAVFADPANDIFVLDTTGRYLAVSFANGALKIFDASDPDGEIELFDESDYTLFEGGFYDHYFGFVASNGVNSSFFALDMDTLTIAGSLSLPGEMHLRVDPDGFCLSQGGVLVRLDISTGTQTELAYTESGVSAISRWNGMTLVKASDGKLLFYDDHAILFDRHDTIPCDFLDLAGEYAVLSSRDSPIVRIMRLETYADKQMFAYDAGYSHDEARVSSDRTTVMLYDYHGFRLFSVSGELIAACDLPDAEQVYDQQYRRGADGDCLEVVYNDGLTRLYSAVDGTLLSEVQRGKQNDSLDEEFFTGRLHILSPLHGTPTVYDKDTGALLGELASEDYLAYVTETGDFLVTEYFTTQMQRYGLLLNDTLETLARLPNLCDILPDGTLVFDDQRGNLRESRIYSTQELMALAREL